MSANTETLLPSLRPSPRVCENCGRKVSGRDTKRCRKCYRKTQTRTHFKPTDYIREFRYYRARFTPEQRARYDEILKYRPLPSVIEQAEAVDVLMREPTPGVCCEMCLKRKDS